MASSSPMKKTFELNANTSTPRGATIKLTVEYQSKITEIEFSDEIRFILL
jgi:hypothetical protein